MADDKPRRSKLKDFWKSLVTRKSFEEQIKGEGRVTYTKESKSTDEVTQPLPTSSSVQVHTQRREVATTVGFGASSDYKEELGATDKIRRFKTETVQESSGLAASSMKDILRDMDKIEKYELKSAETLDSPFSYILRRPNTPSKKPLMKEKAKHVTFYTPTFVGASRSEPSLASATLYDRGSSSQSLIVERQEHIVPKVTIKVPYPQPCDDSTSDEDTPPPLPPKRYYKPRSERKYGSRGSHSTRHGLSAQTGGKAFFRRCLRRFLGVFEKSSSRPQPTTRHHREFYYPPVSRGKVGGQRKVGSRQFNAAADSTEIQKPQNGSAQNATVIQPGHSESTCNLCLVRASIGPHTGAIPKRALNIPVEKKLETLETLCEEILLTIADKLATYQDGSESFTNDAIRKMFEKML